MLFTKKKTIADRDADAKKFNARSKLAVAAHKVANLGEGVCVASSAVVVTNVYYAANSKKRPTRKERKQVEKINRTAAAIAVASSAVYGCATVIEAAVTPLPFDESKYIDLDKEDAEQNAQ